MSTLVVGGYGFIGKRLFSALPGNEPDRIIDRALDGEDIRGYCVSEEIEDVEFDRFDRICHLAAASDVNAHDTHQLHDTFESTYWALRVAERSECKQFTFTSSGAVYGDGKLPISTYGACKLGAEGLVNSWANKTGKRASILRLNNVVGPSCRGVIPDTLRKLKNNPRELQVLGDGTARKRFTYIDEVVKILLDPPEGLHDIASEDTVSVKDVVRWCIEITKTDPHIVWGTTPGGWPGDMPTPGGGSYPGLLSSEAACKRAIFDCMHEVFA